MVTGWSKAATLSLHSGDAQQVGLDDTDTTEVSVDQWVGYPQPLLDPDGSAAFRGKRQSAYS